MKNKLVIILMLGLFCGAFLFAKEESVELYKWGKDQRSIDLPLSVTYENNIVYIYSDYPIYGLSITIKDMNDTIVYSDFVSVDAGIKYETPLDLAYGDYIIEIGSFFGHLSL